uniref:EGF-like module-containing mucin-like hormone receptor-like 2 n=1 Tax=Phallusia mammillata TaxID=59560 RepID=A0A6F9DBE2_9ASCI|nr:EGF-like module-containing mucin-like hormone receptor-like 2 [Phallusia mammillata]
MTKACIFAYGIPAVVVTFNLGLTLLYFDKQQLNEDVCVKDDPQYLPSTTYHAENMCWLQGYSLYFGFLFIIGLAFLNNLGIVILVLRKVIFKRQKIQSTAAKGNKLTQLFMACSLSFTLGLTWIFGFLMLISTDPTYNQVLNWLFALFNSFQGIFIFYITCVKREDMFIFWWNPMRSRFEGFRKRFEDAVGIEPASFSPRTMATNSTRVSATKSNFSSTST